MNWYCWPVVFLVSLGCLAAGTGLRCEVRGNDNKPIYFGEQQANALKFVLFASQDGVKVFQEWNSWGYFARSFWCTDVDNASKSYTISRREHAWDKNAPSTQALKRGELLTTNVNFMDGTWAVSPRLPPRPQTHLRLTPRYEILEDSSARETGAWVGKITGPPVDIYLESGCCKRLNN